jgi:hypothetical protein
MRLPVLLLMLGVCVFLWGFSYKISLYNVSQRSLHTVPDAKLLSKNEDRQAAKGVHRVLAESSRPMMLLQFVSIAFAMVAACITRRYLDERNLSNRRPQTASFIPSLYFRPPPIQSVL